MCSLSLSYNIFFSFYSTVELRYELAIVAVIVLHRRGEKSNFIDIQDERKDRHRDEKSYLEKKTEIEAYMRGRGIHQLKKNLKGERRVREEQKEQVGGGGRSIKKHRQVDC